MFPKLLHGIRVADVGGLLVPLVRLAVILSDAQAVMAVMVEQTQVLNPSFHQGVFAGIAKTPMKCSANCFGVMPQAAASAAIAL